MKRYPTTALGIGSSLREIGRKVAAEVEKYFETKVNPTTIFTKARRMEADSNESAQENATNTDDNGGDNGDKLTPTEVAKAVKKELPLAGSEREAARIVAEKTGKPEGSVRTMTKRYLFPETIILTTSPLVIYRYR